MKSHVHAAMEEPRDENPLTKVWVRISQNALMLSRLSEYIKVAEIAIAAVLGNVEDKRTFSTLSFVKSKLRNRLGGHMDTCVKLFPNHKGNFFLAGRENTEGSRHVNVCFH